MAWWVIALLRLLCVVERAVPIGAVTAEKGRGGFGSRREGVEEASGVRQEWSRVVKTSVSERAHSIMPDLQA
jgi:hypothetical protein